MNTLLDELIWGSHARKLADKIDKNPLFHQYCAHINRSEPQLNTEPWHALGERLHAAWMMLHSVFPDNGITIENYTEDTHNTIVSAGIMANATPYLWSDQIERLADETPMPKHVVSHEIMPQKTMFWSRETAYINNGYENNWMCLCHTKTHIFVIADIIRDREHRAKGEAKISLWTLKLGATWPDDYGDDAEACGRIFKRCAFLNSPYIERQQHRLARHQRRQLEHAGFDESTREEPVNVVKLRHKIVEAAKSSGQHRDIEWKHHWWVSAFYRKQWYPSEQAHRVIWVAPFLKGDLSKPLLEKVYAVVR